MRRINFLNKVFNWGKRRQTTCAKCNVKYKGYSVCPVCGSKLSEKGADSGKKI